MPVVRLEKHFEILGSLNSLKVVNKRMAHISEIDVLIKALLYYHIFSFLKNGRGPEVSTDFYVEMLRSTDSYTEMLRSDVSKVNSRILQVPRLSEGKYPKMSACSAGTKTPIAINFSTLVSLLLLLPEQASLPRHQDDDWRQHA
jgi:hypothetical protein